MDKKAILIFSGNEWAQYQEEYTGSICVVVGNLQLGFRVGMVQVRGRRNNQSFI